MTIGRLSQAAVEVVLQAAPKVRLCQQAGEASPAGDAAGAAWPAGRRGAAEHSDKQHCLCAAACDALVDQRLSKVQPLATTTLVLQRFGPSAQLGLDTQCSLPKSPCS